MISEEEIERDLKKLLPEAKLEWQAIPGTEVEGYLLNRESASRPLAPGRVAEVMDNPPFWGLLWPAGNLLCLLLEQFPSLVDQCKVVDLGCGSGLVSVALAKAGAQVTACDSDASSLLVSRLNVGRNHAKVKFVKNWTEKTGLLVLADFLYEETNLKLLSDFALLSQEILVVDSRLKELDEPGFHYLGEAQGIAVPDLDPHGEFGNIKIWYSGPRKSLWFDRTAEFLACPT